MLSVLVTAVLASAAMLQPSAGEAGGVVQLVYHSDTRGYYLPCG